MKTRSGNVLAILVGPTAVGKTDVAIDLARLLGAEILNIDSRQIYRSLEIGTAKPTAEQRSAVAHHLVDVLDPLERCSAGRFAGMMRNVLSELSGRGVPAIGAGGAGLYVDACLGRLHPLPPADPGIRARYHALLEAEGKGALFSLLSARDPETARRLFANDVQRIVRALEIIELTGGPVRHSFRTIPDPVCDPSTPLIHLTRDRTDLYDRIEARCESMLRHGLPEEVRGLLEAGLPRDAPGLKTVGYSEWVRWVLGELSWDAARELFVRNSRRYAKRQETWFRNRHPARIEFFLQPTEPTETTVARVLDRLGP